MAVLPSGLSLPPLPHLVVLVGLTVGVVVFLLSLQPRVDQRLVASFLPWMAAGASAHVFYQLAPTTDVYPTVVDPLMAAPAVYLTTFVALGGTWGVLTLIGSARGTEGRGPLWVAGIGTSVLLALLVFGALRGAFEGAQPTWSVVGLAVTIPVTAVVYFLLAYARTQVVARARLVGALVIFAHALDGITTTVGVDIVGTGERSPIPRAIMEFAGSLPTAQYIGSGWLFVLVKLAVAVTLLVVFAEYLEEDPVRGNLLFTFVIAVGLGPAVNNLLLFALRENAAVAAAAG